MNERPSPDLATAVRLLREAVAAFEQAQADERAGIAQNERQPSDLPDLDRLLARHGVDMERFGLAKPQEPD